MYTNFVVLAKYIRDHKFGFNSKELFTSIEIA